MKKRVIENIDEAIIELEKPNRYVLVNFSCLKSEPVVFEVYMKTEIRISTAVLVELMNKDIITIDYDRKSNSRKINSKWYKRSSRSIPAL